ncbi:hypothetical protein A2U01_0040276, partial [Trifolium medium]|nr:hypothetical protein [Trifolium medium]
CNNESSENKCPEVTEVQGDGDDEVEDCDDENDNDQDSEPTKSDDVVVERGDDNSCVLTPVQMHEQVEMCTF